MKARQYSPSLGQRLRELRECAGLTLQQVADATREVSADPAAHVSQSYLTQIETRRRESLSLPKIVSLAAVLETTADELVELVPAKRRQRLREGLVALRQSQRRGSRNPLDRYARRAVNLQFRTAVELLAKDVNVPLAMASLATDIALEFLLDVLAAAFVDTKPGERALKDFAKSLSFGEKELWSHEVWQDSVRRFGRQLLLDGQTPQLVELLRYWSCRFETKQASCMFADPDLQRRHGFHLVPYPAAVGVSRARIACALYRRGKVPDDVEPPEPPAVAGARAYIEWYVEEDPRRPVGPLIAAISEVAQRVPSLLPARQQRPKDALEPLADYLGRACDQHGADRRPGEHRRRKPKS